MVDAQGQDIEDKGFTVPDISQIIPELVPKMIHVCITEAGNAVIGTNALVEDCELPATVFSNKPVNPSRLEMVVPLQLLILELTRFKSAIGDVLPGSVVLKKKNGLINIEFMEATTC